MDQSLSAKARDLVARATVLNQANALEKMQKAPVLIADLLALIQIITDRIEQLENARGQL